MEKSNFFVPLSFTQTPQKKCKNILSNECFCSTKYLKFNTFALLLRCLSNLSATASGGVCLCVFILEVVLTVQKHSEFKQFYTHPELIE